MKYIIDMPEDRVVNGKLSLFAEVESPLSTRIQTGIKCEPYTEPDRKAIEDEVWEIARLITLESRDGGLKPDELYRCFGNNGIQSVMKAHSYQEAKAKYEEWKKQKVEIRVGDECVDEDGDKCVVTFSVDDDICDVIYDDGSTDEVHKKFLGKTGRHYDYIEKLLEKMKEG